MNNNASIRLAAIDIDGTLLGPDGSLSRENVAAVNRLRTAGLEVVLASGRSHANMLPYHRALGLSSALVSVHGAVVREADGGPRAATLVDEALVVELTEVGRHEDLSVLYYRDAGIFLDKTSPLTDRDQTMNAEPHRIVSDLLSDCSGVHKVMWMGDPERVARASQRHQSRFLQRLDCYATDPVCLEFISPGVSKAVGLSLLADELGIEPGQVAAFGDGDNDAPMLAWAGFGVAMAHATQAARSAARAIAPEGLAGTALARAIALVFG
ncbi:MAG: Cof-type HAD-IIB family hydrolase [Vulcanimicrobiota bacterium]